MDYGLLKKYTRDINVLFVEDDTHFRKELFELLQDIFPHVTVAVDGQDGLNKYNEYFISSKKYYDLIISDIKMPNLNGIELVDSVYKIHPEQIVVILSARNEFDYLLPLINLGIQQFFTKPINYTTFIEDMLKICNKIYINNLDDESTIIKIDNSSFWDKEKKELIQDNRKIKLTKKEIILVDRILKQNGRIYTVDELISTIWFEEFDLNADIKNLKNLISRLRKKVPNLHIKNIYGMGYKADLPIMD
ncbi:response regulator transcription factor [Poseidonibacter ostreae]|uniref:Response regulator n=1 Tax=Poseidonibacter ostreae TaxID=2654171 RepID=A0A6L4WPL6_9BACT|nr:response regulator transcription factor [Poseidonibacter ostreae]KAB7881197.1 response regulator [Poseidonibacter ostreae]KAB7883140.1 response regulator [Poseidonibacter ostreae]KAB7886213.1 response regulator [Poseidonibacter ostreae]